MNADAILLNAIFSFPLNYIPGFVKGHVNENF